MYEKSQKLRTEILVHLANAKPFNKYFECSVKSMPQGMLSTHYNCMPKQIKKNQQNKFTFCFLDENEFNKIACSINR